MTVVVRAVKRTVKEGGVKAVDRVWWWALRTPEGLPFCENCRKLTCGAAAVPTASSSRTRRSRIDAKCSTLVTLSRSSAATPLRDFPARAGGQGYMGYTGYKGYTGYIQSTGVYGVYPEQGGIWGISSPRG